MRNILSQFPALDQQVRGQKLTYLDSAATTLKPKVVIDAVTNFLSYGTANVHRGAHFLSDQATQQFEDSRQKVAGFIGAASAEEIVFTSGTTDGLNLLASSLGQSLKEGDVVLLSQMEHHANVVPWHLLKKAKGIELRFVNVTDQGELDEADFAQKLDARVKVVSLVHCSNTLGTVNPVQRLFAQAKKMGAMTILDAAQSVSCMPIDVKKLDCDFLVFSGHKLFGPYGIGVLWGPLEKLNQLPPYRGGGSMIEKVSMEDSTYLSAPHRFEAGTPNIEGVIGLGAAISFVESLGWDKVAAHEDKILAQAHAVISDIKGIRILGPQKNKKNIISFVADFGHPTDLGHLLDQQGVAVRTGHHCTQPLMGCLGVTATTRASFSIYSTEDDVHRLDAALRKAKEILS